MSEPAGDGEPVEISTSRVEAFSDGVFAIAITLLILDVRLPAGAAHDLGHALLGLWPQYAAYAVTFLLIGMVWMNHHVMFHFIVRTDRVLLTLNLLLLLDVAFLPFPTSVLAESIGDPVNARAAVLAYGSTLTIGGVFFNALWWYAAKSHRHLGAHIEPAEARQLALRFVVGPIAYLVVTLLGLVNAWIAICCFVGLLLFVLSVRLDAGHRAGQIASPANTRQANIRRVNTRRVNTKIGLKPLTGKDFSPIDEMISPLWTDEPPAGARPIRSASR